MTIQLPKGCEDSIRQHAERTYPEECCGVMYGHDDADGVRHVSEVQAIDNIKDENRARRFLIDPKDLLAAEKSARAKGVDVVGIYHSHPDHPSLASEFDRDHAMPFWSYVIVSCHKGKSDSLQSFRLRDDRSQFDEETVIP